MKLVVKENLDSPLTVTVEYPKYDSTVDKIINKIKRLGGFITGCDNGRLYQVNILEIYYIESVDTRSFIYTQDAVFCADKKLYQFENQLKEFGFIRISKSCLLNIDVLESIKNLVNSKLEAVLINGEKLIVSRTYLGSIKKILSMEDDQ